MSIPANVTAYQQTYNWMIGRTISTPCANISDTIWTCALTASGGYQAQAVWNTAGNSSYTVPSPFVQYRDLAGNTIATSRGSSITIGIQPLLLEVSGLSPVSGPPQPPTNLTAIVR